MPATAAANPFRVQRIHSLPYVFMEENGQDILARLDRLGGRGAVIGPHGFGKTTFLRSLEHPLRARGLTPHWFSRHDGYEGWASALLRKFPDQWKSTDIVLIDNAELLHPGAWFRVLRRLRRTAGILITMPRPGRLPTLYTCRTSPPLLDHLLSTLVPEASDNFRAEAHRLYHDGQGNLRSVFFRLYDQCAGRTEPRLEAEKRVQYNALYPGTKFGL